MQLCNKFEKKNHLKQKLAKKNKYICKNSVKFNPKYENLHPDVFLKWYAPQTGIVSHGKTCVMAKFFFHTDQVLKVEETCTYQNGNDRNNNHPIIAQVDNQIWNGKKYFLNSYHSLCTLVTGKHTTVSVLQTPAWYYNSLENGPQKVWKTVNCCSPVF